jgi:tetratricopeptide (TPR) repeat protein
MAELALLYQANGFTDEALAGYAGLRAVDSRNAQWCHLPAVILAGQGRLDEAEPLFRRAAELAPDYLPAHVRAADVALKANRLDEAQRGYETVLVRFGEQPYALLGLARAAIARREWTRAEALLRRSLTADPNFVGGLSLLATVLKQLGREEEADEIAVRVNRREFVDLKDPWVDALLDDCYDPYQLSVAASVAIFRRDSVLAKRCLERAAALAPHPAPYLRQLGQLGYLTRNYVEAGNHLAKAVALAPTDAEAWTVWANVLLAAGNRQGAYRVLLDGLSHCPESGALRYVYGHLLNEDGQQARAIAELRMAKRFRSTQADVFIELANAYFKVGETEAGVAEMKEALRVQPDHPAALMVVARHAIDQGDAAAAREWISRIRQQTRLAPDAVELVLNEFQEKFGRSP